MPKILNEQQVQAYERDGFVFPVDVLSLAEVRSYRQELEDWERARGAAIDFPQKSKSYLLFNWADQLVHHPRILDAVEDLIGPDILVYHSTLFLKEARTPAFVRWHQDSTYFYLEPHLHVTAWVALSEASVQAGCMQALPGSHQWGAFEHDDKPEPLNMIRRGQGISACFDQAQGRFMPVAAGQMSLHHTDLVHASGGNDSDDRRIGYAISYIPAHVRPVGAVRPSALCVRGRSHGHFTEEERLREPLSIQAQGNHSRALALFRSLQDAGFQAPAQETA
ncbi:MAG: phytanoyl-CoA dioxygenase family protein [Betaproteobacteria bacterium]|nr:phytanoyl-CoA dioxygenase family protein [Betaproteobacteria bacterium]